MEAARRLDFRGSNGIGALFLYAFICAGAVEAQITPKSTDGVYTEQELDQMDPASPNPYLAFMPAAVEPDWPYWRSWVWVQAKEQTATPLPRSTRVVDQTEQETNNTLQTATYLPTLGTAAGKDSVAIVDGSFPTPIPPAVVTTPPEDNGSIPLAGLVAVQPRETLVMTAQLGDGPHGASGSGSGDFDFYKLANIQEGQFIEVDIDRGIHSILDSFLAIWDSSGALLALNDDDPRAPTLDSYLTFIAPSPGDYYVSVGSFSSPFPANPFDSSSGSGAGSEGSYGIFIGLEGGGKDLDHFSFDARAGDIVGVSADDAAATAALFAPDGALLVQSSQNFGFIYPGISQLPRVGNALLAYVVSEPGRYALRFFGPEAGAWSGEIRLFRPPLESAGDARQILFIDFDGATVDTSIFFGAGGIATLSPLSAFLSNWGLDASDEDAVIDAILAVTAENIRLDLIEKGLADTFDIEIRNSRDHADPFGQANVSRVIVGGTIEESGIPTIGIAQSIDIGNFNGRETALVLLDVLSGPPIFFDSLNSYFLAPGVSKIDIVATGVGNIVAHEAGHFFGNFHTENSITLPNIMDTGGNMPNTIGVGPDLIFGSDDDFDVDFGVDVYEPFEGFGGKEDTLNMIAFALLTGLDRNELFVDLDAGVNGIGSLSSPLNKLGDAVIKANPEALIRIFPSASPETFAGANRISKPLTLVNEVPSGGKVTVGRQN